MMTYRMFSLGMTVTVLFVLSAAAFAQTKTEEATHDGKVVSITSGKLVMTKKGGTDGKEHIHTLAANAKVTLDGKACKATDLKTGMKIRVTTKTSDATVATHIDAIDKNATFAHTHDGKLVSMTKDTFVMSVKDGKEHSHTLAADVKVTCDGDVCKLSDLKAGMKIRVTTKKTDKDAAIEIEAIDKDAGFAQGS